MTNNDSDALSIDIVSDVVCPWCIIGYRQLSKALDATGVRAEIKWHPFELNPQMPSAGQNLREHIIEKYGISEADSDRNRHQMTQLGVELDFEFNFTEDMRMPNTFLAHQLLHWANHKEKQHELKMELFKVHFTQLRNLGDVTTLADAAKAVGLDRAEALAILDDQRYAKSVREEQQFWLQQGIQGVPATVFKRKHLVSGAQGEAGFTQVLNTLKMELASED